MFASVVSDPEFFSKLGPTRNARPDLQLGDQIVISAVRSEMRDFQEKKCLQPTKV